LEYNTHKAITDYIRIQYPYILFRTDMGGTRLPIGLAVKMKRLQKCKGFPDLFLYTSRKGYHGLAIEIKEKEYLKKNGEPKDERIAQQLKVISQLKKEGYLAVFCIGFDEAKKTIDGYLQ